MPRKLRHTILGCKLNGSPQSWAERYKDDFLGVGRYPEEASASACRQCDIHDCLNMMALHHLEYKIPVVAKAFLKQGFDVVVDYFCGDWWKQDEESRRCMDKSQKKKQHLEWFAPFSKGLLLGLLAERWKDVARICAWVEPDLPHEGLGELEEDELVDVYTCVAAGMRPEPMPGLAKVEARLRKCRPMRPRLLFQAWEAARNKDQAAFDQAFTKSVAHYRANLSWARIAEDWIATHQSVVGLAARRLGMKLPKLPPELDAAVLTPESLGLSRKRR